jgi:hypothetical protein
LLAAAEEPAGPAAVPGLMTRIGERIELYYARARSIMSQESVRLEPLGYDLLPDGSHVRQLVFELRVAWDAVTDGARPPEATVLRQLISVDGRPPRAGDEPGCLDPKSVSAEPLGMLLSGRQREFAFTWRNVGRTDGHPSVALDYKSVNPQPPEVTWKGECVSIELPGRTRGRDDGGSVAARRAVDRCRRDSSAPNASAHRIADQPDRGTRRYVDSLPSGRISRSGGDRDAAGID